MKGDISEAIKWYLRAVDSGDKGAGYHLGMLYMNGTGVEQDDNQAAKWFQVSAERGIADSQCRLAFFYMMGRGVHHQEEEAAHWYKSAALQGNVVAQVNLGILYADGRGVPRDDVQAYSWFSVALRDVKDPLMDSLNSLLDLDLMGKDEARLVAKNLRGRLAEKMKVEEVVKAEELAMVLKNKIGSNS